MTYLSFNRTFKGKGLTGVFNETVVGGRIFMTNIIKLQYLHKYLKVEEVPLPRSLLLLVFRCYSSGTRVNKVETV